MPDGRSRARFRPSKAVRGERGGPVPACGRADERLDVPFARAETCAYSVYARSDGVRARRRSNEMAGKLNPAAIARASDPYVRG
jgi:hypothetical protein